MTTTGYQKTEGGSYYGVLIRCADGRVFLSASATAMPSLFHKRSDAVQHRRDLKANGFPKTKVVRVAWTLTYVVPNPKLKTVKRK